jgi:hypothetical protein
MSLSANFPTTRPSLLLDFVNSGQMDPRITFSRASGATWFNSAGTLIGVDASSSSLTVGTGQQTLTLAATAGVDRGWIVGTSVLLSASTVTNTMTGVVVSYTASTQVLVVNVASVVGSGTYATWQVSNLMPRLDYNPSTLAALGFLVEESRTNSIRNNTMVGAVAGTPGTAPTNWVTVSTGLTRTVVGTGTSNGINYIDIRFNGTTSGVIDIQVKPDGNVGPISGSTGQSWTESSWVAIVGGSTANITDQWLVINEYSAGPTYLRTSNVVSNILAGGATLTRVSGASTLGASTTIVEPVIVLRTGSSVAIDITLRIGLPQLELGAFATSVIPTTTTALTRAADVASVNTLSPWFNATEGTLFAQYIRAGLTPSGGAAGFDDGAANNMIRFVFGTATPANQRFDVNTGGVSQATVLVNATGVVNTLYKDAGAYKLNDIAATENGAAVGTDNVATIPTVTNLKIGSNPIVAYLNGWIQRITYYPRRLSNAELQAITA